MKNCHKATENAKINAVLNSRKQFLVSDKNVGISDQLKDFQTPHVIRITLIPSFCKSKLEYGLVIDFVKSQKFFYEIRFLH